MSTTIAISLTPMLCSKLLKSKKVTVDADGNLVEIQPRLNWYERFVVRGFLDRLDRLYANVLRWCVDHKVATIAMASGVFLLSLVPVFTGMIGTDYMQQQDNGRLSITVELQRGTRIEETSRIARLIEQHIVSLVPETQLISTSLGSSDDADLSAMFSTTNNNKISMTVRTSKKYERERTIFDIAEVIRQDLAAMPEVVTYKVDNSSMGGMSMGSTVDVEVYGYSFEETNAVVADLTQRIKGIPGARDIDVSREEDRAELQIIFDKEKLARHGLNEATVATYVRNRVNGMTCGYLKEDGEEYDIVVRFTEEYRNSITDLEELPINAPTGEIIKLKELAEVEEYWCPPEIERQSRQRIVTVSVTPYGTSMGELAEAIQAEINQMDIPQRSQHRLWRQLRGPAGNLRRHGLAHGTHPHAGVRGDGLAVRVVLQAVHHHDGHPVCHHGGYPGLAHHEYHAGYDRCARCHPAGGHRGKERHCAGGLHQPDARPGLRTEGGHRPVRRVPFAPVLMTAITTILGMVPMALSTSEGSEMWVPMGIVVIGGATVSTLVTLIIVPVLYAAMSRHGERDKEEKERKEYIFMQLKPKN